MGTKNSSIRIRIRFNPVSVFKEEWDGIIEKKRGARELVKHVRKRDQIKRKRKSI